MSYIRDAETPTAWPAPLFHQFLATVIFSRYFIRFAPKPVKADHCANSRRYSERGISRTRPSLIYGRLIPRSLDAKEDSNVTRTEDVDGISPITERKIDRSRFRSAHGNLKLRDIFRILL